MGSEMGWLLRRTKRVEELIAQPAVMSMADELARHIERYCAAEAVKVGELDVSVLPTRSKSYIRITWGSRPCHQCNGTGHVGEMADYCPICQGSGVR
jgi:hypothetical protein